jgi:hypothetical protein
VRYLVKLEELYSEHVNMEIFQSYKSVYLPTRHLSNCNVCGLFIVLPIGKNPQLKLSGSVPHVSLSLQVLHPQSRRLQDIDISY